jgi:hypothetical protein
MGFILGLIYICKRITFDFLQNFRKFSLCKKHKYDRKKITEFLFQKTHNFMMFEIGLK